MPLLRGDDDPIDEAIGEYCAEMTPSPVFMIRRGRYKYIHCDVDPPMLFDLERDPAERANLADDPAFADIAEAFRAEVAGRWNSAEIRANVIAAQKSRRAIYEAMTAAGTLTSWDYQPVRDAANEYVRNHMDWTAAAEKYRVPLRDGDDRT